jgi:4-amino-4-deoxy-L-arabinose transferase-like glycosyltransferase
VSRLRWAGSENSYLLDVLLLSAVAGVLRLWGIGFDLPNLYHRDEARYVTIPLQILKSGDYNPHFFNYPTFFFYLLALAYIVYFLFMASRGRIGSLDGLVLPEQVLPNVVGRATMPSQFLVGRGFVALTGLLTVGLVYWITRRAYGRRAGLLAGLLLSLSPTHIRNSHFVAPDVTMILIVVACFALCHEVWLGGRRRDYVLAGLLAGLASSTKYNAYPIFIPLLVADLLRREGEGWFSAGILLAAVFSVAGFLVGTPYSVLDLPTFLNGLAFEVRHYATLGDPGVEGQNALLWYASFLARSEGLLLPLALLEAARGFLARSQKVLLFLSFPTAYLFLVSLGAVKNDRTVLTIVPFLCMLAGAFLDRALGVLQIRMESNRRATAMSFFAAALVVLALLWPAWQAAQINTRFMHEDVRTTVTQWMEAELPAGSRIVGEYYSPLLVDSAHHFRWIDRAIDQPIEWYQQNADYVVFVENRYGGFYLDPSRYAAEVGSYEEMFKRFSPVREFQGGALGNPIHAMVYKVAP